MPIQTPDTIGVSQTKITPAAQEVSVYQGGTRADVPEPPQDNRYMQLGQALEKFAAGPGQRLANDAAKKSIDKQMAAGELNAQLLAKDKSLKNLNEAVADGRIPAGASPAYIFAMKANLLKLRGEQSQMRMREDYYANSALRNDDNSQAFIQWAAKWQTDNEDAVLKDTQGNQAYSALEISHSNFNSRVSDGLRGLEQEHIAHRVSEREKLGEQYASTLMATRLEVFQANVPANVRDNAALASALIDVGYNATTGAATYGMDKSKVSAMMQNAILAKAVSTKDPTYLRIADYITTPGGTLSKTGRFVEKAQQAREHIAAEVETERNQREKHAFADAEGSLDDRAKLWGERYRFSQGEFEQKKLVDVQMNRALNFKNILSLTPQEMGQQKDALEQIRLVSPKEAINASELLLKAKDTFQTAENKVNFPLKEMEIHNAILEDPGTPSTNKMIDRALHDSAISGEQWLRLRALSDKTAQDNMKHEKLLNDDAFKRLETAIGRAVNNSPGDPFGAAALHAGAAQLELRELAVRTAEENPQMTPLQVARAIQPEMKDIAGRYNETMKEVLDQEEALQKGRDEVTKEALRMSKPEAQAAQAAQVKKAEAQAAAIKALDQQAAGVKPQATLAPAPTADYNPKTFDTKLSAKNEETFQAWKKKYAPKDSGADYDLRGAFKAGVKPDPKTGHWPDTFKKPNHPTFSNESRYAKFGKPGHWQGDKFIPAP